MILDIPGDVEDPKQETNDAGHWSREATCLLISLYKEHEEEMEDPTKKKKETWANIAAEMKKKGYSFSAIQIDNKRRGCCDHIKI